MAVASPKNLYYRRLVAEANAKACWICFKPSSCVLINDDQDFFYICLGHLTDPKFATARDAEDVAQKKKDEEIEKEIEAVKKEFAEKMRKKMDRRRQKEFEEEGKKAFEGEGKKECEEEGKKAEAEKKTHEEDETEMEKEREEKVKELEKKKEPEKAKVEGPRIFELHKDFFHMRQQRRAQAAVAKRQAERMRNPALFPSVPTELPK